MINLMAHYKNDLVVGNPDPPGRKLVVGMSQINNSFENTHYFPLSIGFLHAYASKHASNFQDFEFVEPLYKRVPVDEAVEQFRDADIACFSVYVWNFNLSCQIAKRLKEIKPNIFILFGGCHIPDSLDKGLDKFVRDNPHIDAFAVGEGERVFASFLDNFHSRTLGAVPSLAFLHQGQVVFTPLAPRIEDLNEVPSPYLEGYFNSIMADDSEAEWVALFETNRGCPFKCTFCDWGTNSKNRMADYDLENRIYKEIDWFADHEVSFVYCCDANFGIRKRDLDIAQYFARIKEEKGFPHRFSVQNTKNSTDASYNIQKVLVDSGLDKGVLLAFQSLHEPTLEAVKRKNIKLQTFFDLQKRFTEDGVITFSDIIVGLPLETYDTFIDGVSTLIEHGQHNRIQFNNLSVLPNAPMVEDIEKYGLDVVETQIINIHGSLADTEEIMETQQLIVGSATMPREDWVKARAFGFMTALLHFDKLMQIPSIVAHMTSGVRYKDIIDAFLMASDSYPTLQQISQRFFDKAIDIQQGGAEFCESREWLNIWWPADELAYIRLATGGLLDSFYAESSELLRSIVNIPEGALEDSINLNRKLLKSPSVTGDETISMDWNVIDVYKNGLVNKKVELSQERVDLRIIRDDHWDNWDDWCRRVIWWGNKRGDYIYGYERI